MAEYLVFARKYRPKKFSEVVGQEAIVTTLINALRGNRVAHAYLFTGSRGTGKTTLARLFAKALNCKQLSADFEPCNACSSCIDIASGHSLDVLEIDGASHRGIEDIRQINETIGYAPSGNYKIYLIDEVHMLTKEAFNALLKTLEEPPERVKFFFATTEPHKIPATILSRCQRYNLGRIPEYKIIEKLTSIAQDVHVEISQEALKVIADIAEGGLRDAQSLLDQVLGFGEKCISKSMVLELLGMVPEEIFLSLDEAVSKNDFRAAFRLAHQVYASGKNLSSFMEELIGHYRSLLFSKMDKNPNKPSNYTEKQCMDILEILSEATHTFKSAPSQLIALEMLLLKIIKTSQRISLEDLILKLNDLEEKLIASNPSSSISQDDISIKAPMLTSSAKASNGESKPKDLEKVTAPNPPSPTLQNDISIKAPILTSSAKASNGECKPKDLEKVTAPNPPSPILQNDISPTAQMHAPLANASNEKHPIESKAKEETIKEASPTILKDVKPQIESILGKTVEDPSPKQEELPKKNNDHHLSALSKQSRYETLMRFAAKELNGSLKKE